MASARQPHRASRSKKGRKIGRNFRWGGVDHTVSHYRSRHNIPPGYRRDLHIRMPVLRRIRRERARGQG